MRKGAGLWVVDRKHLLLLMKLDGRFSIPGGKVESDEYPIVAGIREVFEETGVVSYVPHEDKCFFTEATDELHGTNFYCWEAQVASSDYKRIPPEGTPVWVSLDNVRKMPATDWIYPNWMANAIRFFDDS